MLTKINQEKVSALHYSPLRRVWTLLRIVKFIATWVLKYKNCHTEVLHLSDPSPSLFQNGPSAQYGWLAQEFHGRAWVFSLYCSSIPFTCQWDWAVLAHSNTREFYAPMKILVWLECSSAIHLWTTLNLLKKHPGDRSQAKNLHQSGRTSTTATGNEPSSLHLHFPSLYCQLFKCQREGRGTYGNREGLL